MLLRFWSGLLVAVTFALVLLGGLVHTQGASLACPDWPLCYGMVMPPMAGDILLEHSHRLLASAVGLLVIGQAALVWRARGAVRAELFAPSLLGLGLVVLQGTLGGITVLWRLPPPISIAHWSLSMLFFCWTVLMAWRLYEAERASAGTHMPLASVGARPALPGAGGVWLAAGFVWLQGVLGAAVRHTHASLSCGQQGFWCNDHFWPQTGAQGLQFAHRLAAVVALVLVGFGTARASRAARQVGRASTRRLARAAHALVLVQALFGWRTLTSGVHLHTVMVHVAGAALLLGTLVAMGLSTRPSLFARAARPAAGAAPEGHPLAATLAHP